jgi:hypothetical protein
MGAGASIPEQIDEFEAQTLAGELWTDAMQQSFNELAVDGKITAAQFIGARDAAGADTGVEEIELAEETVSLVVSESEPVVSAFGTEAAVAAPAADSVSAVEAVDATQAGDSAIVEATTNAFGADEVVVSEAHAADSISAVEAVDATQAGDSAVVEAAPAKEEVATPSAAPAEEAGIVGLEGKLEVLFKNEDADSSGFIDKTELTKMVLCLGLNSDDPKVQKYQEETALGDADADGDNKVSLDEFKEFMTDFLEDADPAEFEENYAKAIAAQ